MSSNESILKRLEDLELVVKELKEESVKKAKQEAEYMEARGEALSCYFKCTHGW